MALDTNPSHNDYVCDVIGTKNIEIEIIYNKFLEEQFNFLGDSFDVAWNKVGLVKRILEKGFKVNHTYLSLAIQYTLEIIEDFNTTNKLGWFKGKVNVDDFIKTYVYLMQAKLRYYNTNNKLNQELIDKYYIQELSCLEEVEEFVNNEFTENYGMGEYSIVLYIDNNFYELIIKLEPTIDNKVNYALQEIEKPQL